MTGLVGRKDLDLELDRPGQRKAVSERDYCPGSEKATSLPENFKVDFSASFELFYSVAVLEMKQISRRVRF